MGDCLMSADENLNNVQFMSVNHLMNNVPAGESSKGLPMGKDPELMHIKREGISGAEQWNSEGVAAVRKSIRNGTVDPLHVNGSIEDGHHRLLMAHDMGVERLPVTSSPGYRNKFGGVF